MNAQVNIALSDADILIFMTDNRDNIPTDHQLIKILQQTDTPCLIVINKCDLLQDAQKAELVKKWSALIPKGRIYTISALNKTGVDALHSDIRKQLPEHPAFYDLDEITDQTERAIAAEIIREKIFLQYQQEIPYNYEVIVDAYKDKGDIIAISAVIYVGRDTHKSIIIGKGGSAIKQLGIASRQDIEQFAGKKIFLELFVKVKENWKNDDRTLRHFGYES